MDLVGLGLQILVLGPLLLTGQRFLRFLHFLLGEDRVGGATEALTLTASIFSIYCMGRMLTHESQYQHVLGLASLVHRKFEEIVLAFEAASDSPTSSILNKGFDSTFGRLVEPYFATLGQEIRHVTDGTSNWWMRMSLGRGPVEKAFAIVFGYFLVGISLAVYMNILTVGTIKTAEKALRTAVRQQLLVVKVFSQPTLPSTVRY